MLRFLIVIAIGGLLAACTGLGEDEETASPAGAGGIASPAPRDTGDAEPSLSVPSSPDISPGMSPGTGGDTGGMDAAASCKEAWEVLADQRLSSTTELAELTEEVEATIQSCETVDEWVEGARTVIDDVDTTSAEFLLRMRCSEQALSDTPICEELASS